MDRRSFLRRGASVVGLAGLAGCTAWYTSEEEEEADAGPEIQLVEDPPNAVYVPTHRETMRMLEPIDAGEYRLAPMLSYPHPFWLVSGRETTLEEPESSAGVHLMFTLWDAETGTVLPVESGASIELERGGESIGPPISPWPMISQGMGMHFGDNVALEADGTYTATVELPPIEVRKTGALEGRFTEFETATFEFTYDDDFRQEVVDVDYLDEAHWGLKGALEPMEHGSGDDHEGGDHEGEDGDGGHDDHEGETGDHDDHDDHEDADHVPYSALPKPEEYPGTHLFEPRDGEESEDGSETDGDDGSDDYPRSGDAVFVSTLLEPGSRLLDGDANEDDRYLLVSPRTPYNRVPLADMVLTATLERDGTTVLETDLEQTLDDEFGLHYGTAVDDVESGDTLTVTIEGVPQVARHQGYETAFLDMPPIDLEVVL